MNQSSTNDRNMLKIGVKTVKQTNKATKNVFIWKRLKDFSFRWFNIKYKYCRLYKDISICYKNTILWLVQCMWFSLWDFKHYQWNHFVLELIVMGSNPPAKAFFVKSTKGWWFYSGARSCMKYCKEMRLRYL
jgi:hypothetical protein